METYKSMIESARSNGASNEQLTNITTDALCRVMEHLKQTDEKMYETMLLEQYTALFGHHFTESAAIERVAKMHHTDKSGNEVKGEHFTIQRAATICEKVVPNGNTYDVYVALNATYHDLNKLFSRWFSSDTEQYIIDAALSLWFTDEDCDKGAEKIWFANYN